ncbi:MAG TPA: hypothetical protein VI968_01480 [archaeon]|nr:hypothetical protein [archaeon]
MVWKLIITIVVVLVAITALMPYLPLKALFSKFDYTNSNPVLPFQESVVPGDVSFVLAADAYDGFSFIAVNKNVTVFGSTAGYAQNVEVATDGDIGLEGYSGNVVVDGITIFNGSLTKLTVPGVKIKTSSVYLEAGGFDTQNIVTKILRLNNINGTIIVKGTETRFSGMLEIKDAAFDVSVKNFTLTIKGKAKAIEIPSAGLKFT